MGDNKNDTKGLFWLGGIIVVGFIITTLCLYDSKISEFNVLVITLANGFMVVVSYFFGSSIMSIKNKGTGGRRDSDNE